MRNLPKEKILDLELYLVIRQAVRQNFGQAEQNAFVLSLGKSYFGSPRVGVDYLWHFNPFNTNTANLYAGVGGAIGFGEETDFGTRTNFSEQEMKRVSVQEVYLV
ncbi:MAG: hypothetical protein MZV64_44205 [Ignavibacteriales bacterium]|nr:hypothetical protein [Ignavibacteriales bacterium]